MKQRNKCKKCSKNKRNLSPSLQWCWFLSQSPSPSPQVPLLQQLRSPFRNNFDDHQHGDGGGDDDDGGDDGGGDDDGDGGGDDDNLKRMTC